ncbi:MAG: SPFH domain-containing protein [Gemmataceae bacterium]|nr:SPFH domain-containing protein [Gemmataceae bacterium]
MIDWLLSWLWWARDTALYALWWLWSALWMVAQRYPAQTAIALFAFIRMWGALIQTGQQGVLFSWGRARRVLEPGFHPLIPVVQDVRKLPARSMSLELPRQRLATADGLVFDVDATLVCRIVDAIKATVEIDDLRAGLITALSLTVHEVIRSKTRAELAGKESLDAEIKSRLQERLGAWGVEAEAAGLNTIAPTRTTTRLSQQSRRIRERRQALTMFRAEGVPVESALALLGTSRQVVGHGHARYRKHRIKKPAPVEMPPPPPLEEEALIDEELGV